MRSSARWVAGSVVLVLVAQASTGAEIRDLQVQPKGRNLVVSLRLEEAFNEEIDTRLRSGLEISFQYTVRLRRKRRRFLDKTVSERYVVVSAQFSNLTKMYKLARLLDGTVTEYDVTENASLMRSWMTEIDEMALFDPRDFPEPGTYYVRVQAQLLSRFKLLFVPWDLESGWAQSRMLRLERGDSWQLLGEEAVEP